MGSVITQHWQGRLPALISLFGILIAVRVLVHLGYGTLPAPLPFAMIVLILLADAALLIWQATGTIRACERCLKIAGGVVLYWASYGVVIASAIYLLTDVTSLVSASVPLRIKTTAAPLELPVHGGVATIEGNIGFDTYNALKSRLDAPQHGILQLQLNSNGGRIYAARAIAKLVLENGLDTQVLIQCNSACTLVFLAGKRRILPENARLGFHQYALASTVPLIDTANEQQKDIGFFRSRGVSDSFINRMFQAEHRDIWFPDRKELLAAGVLTP